MPENHNDKKAVAREGIQRLKGFFIEIGMPVTLKEAGAKKEDFPKLLETLKKNKGNKLGSFMKLKLSDAKKIYEMAWE
ncbi:MAG: hypothetical protein EA383_17990 [Spirochaetaceae bacterium]|nr:MAG: hypothetical protein EA383_17990 [Spirochaetaceae bacterium]